MSKFGYRHFRHTLLVEITTSLEMIYVYNANINDTMFLNLNKGHIPRMMETGKPNFC